MKEKLLLPESPLQILPTLALKLGIKEALILQQLHYRLLNSPYRRDGYTWYRHTYLNWHKQFPFYSEKTISRAFINLEQDQIIISSQKYNPAKVMKTKWYRINYEKLYRELGVQYDSISQTVINFHTQLEDSEQYLKKEESTSTHAIRSQNDSSNPTKESSNEPQIVFQLEDEKASSIKEQLKEESKNTIVANRDVMAEIINYLNTKTNRNYRVNNQATRRFINARLKEGYQLEDFKQVIDCKVKQWLQDPKMKTYLRPNTLFNPTNFENYLVESKEIQIKQMKREIKPIVLDFNAGEED